MEIGAVKQAFNNELILLKKNLNQARIQIIHKLTRKAKQLTEKKAPDTLKEKLKRKAESAVREVLIIKKIKARDIGKFAITHKGKLEDYLNKPQVDNDKACARLLLHKSLQEKYKFLRNRFSNIPIKDLFMSRQERKKLKKEEQQKKKEKKKKNKVVNAEGDWDVEDVNTVGKKLSKDDKAVDDSDVMSGHDDDQLNSEAEPDDVDQDMSDAEDQASDAEIASDEENAEARMDDNEDQEDNAADTESDEESDVGSEDFGKLVEIAPEPKQKKPAAPITKDSKLQKIETKPKPERVRSKEGKQKDNNKNKNLKDKILNKKFKKDADDVTSSTKVVDPFFITATGENYMSIAEPRQPDEFKEEHRQGNRKHRRAVMFGHVPKTKPRQNSFDPQNGKVDRQNNNFDRYNKFNKPNIDRDSRNKGQNQGYQRKNDNFSNNNNKFNDRKTKFEERNDKRQDDKPEKLHPSWEAKKKQSGILPFQGKKIVFNDG